MTQCCTQPWPVAQHVPRDNKYRIVCQTCNTELTQPCPTAPDAFRVYVDGLTRPRPTPAPES